MKTLRFSFDPLSPDARLAFEQLPELLEGVHHEMIYEPALRCPPRGQALLSLAFASTATGLMPNRWVLENVLRHADDPDDPASLQALAQLLAPQRDPHSPQVQAELQSATDKALARGVTHEPVVEVDGKRFVGEIGLALLAAWLGQP
jgi:2-hydroxychromene-2-carboxylate isomerase